MGLSLRARITGLEAGSFAIRSKRATFAENEHDHKKSCFALIELIRASLSFNSLQAPILHP